MVGKRTLCALTIAVGLGLTPAVARNTVSSEGVLESWLFAVARTTYGIPYRWGGEDPRYGMDCSAFVRWVYSRLGVALPRTSAQQFAASRPVREYKPGYLLFFSESRQRIDHVGIYIGRGYMLHASGKWGQVVTEPVANYASILVAIASPWR